MNFAFSESQEMLRQSARQFLARVSTPERVMAAMMKPLGYDPEVWRELSERLGWPALIIPEAYGGFGGDYVDLIAIMEEAGRSLFCAPLFSTTCLATNALLIAGNAEQKKEHLPGIASGEMTATVVYTGRVPVMARRSGGDYILDGTSPHVVDAESAKLLIVFARTSEGPSLFVVRSDASGLYRRPFPTMDATRKQGEIALDEVRVPASDLLGPAGSGERTLSEVLALACVALSAEQVGGAQACLDMAVDYAKTRTQFGRAIGSFQAIKHKCADMFVLLESARSASYYAGWAAAHERSELASAASVAKASCSEAYFHCASENIQIHGGVGFTWEHPAHLYFKRARSSETLLGDPTSHRELIAKQLLG